MLRLTRLQALAAAAQPEKLQGVKQHLEPLGVVAMHLHLMHGAVLQHQGGAAIHAGEVMLIALHRGKQRFPAGQVAAADQAPLLQVPQVAIHGGQPHWLGALPQQGVQLLPREFPIRMAQLVQQHLLAIAGGGNLGRHGRVNGAAA